MLKNLNSMESKSVGNDDNNAESSVEEIVMPALPSLDGNYCCWGDECECIGIPGQAFYQCCHLECVNEERGFTTHAW